MRRDPAHYGAAIALGDGEVTLAELARAYVALARGGSRIPLRIARSEPVQAGVRVVSAPIAALIGDVLSDATARQAAFGRDSVLELPFPVAVKTGTSKAYRDNWAVGYTRELTVAVWVGNFDGRPMRESSGVTGAGPLFRDVMLAAVRALVAGEPEPLVSRRALVSLEVCALSGERPGPDCPHRLLEWFEPGTQPAQRCSMHVRAPDGGVLERYPGPYVAWAVSAGRPLHDGRTGAGASLAVRFPYDGARFLIDPALDPAAQHIVLGASGGDSERLSFVLDGRPLGDVAAPFSLPWRLRRGAHTLSVMNQRGARSEPVEFVVE